MPDSCISLLATQVINLYVLPLRDVIELAKKKGFLINLFSFVFHVGVKTSALPEAKGQGRSALGAGGEGQRLIFHWGQRGKAEEQLEVMEGSQICPSWEICQFAEVRLRY